MKKIIIVILFSFVVANIFAQTDKSPQEYTISVNRMMSNNFYQSQGDSLHFKALQHIEWLNKLYGEK